MILSNVSYAEKIYVPLIQDDIVTVIPYQGTVNHLAIPEISSNNGYKDLVLQCEDDITYFAMAYHVYFDDVKLTATEGKIVIDEEGTAGDGYVNYLKGYIEGSETVSVTGKVYYNGEPYGDVTKTCIRTKFSAENTLKVPTFSGNSQGKLVIQCEKDVVYYIMAYDCLRSDTDPSVTTDNGVAITLEKEHVGEVFYVKGFVERKNSDPVTIIGEVYTGGQTLSYQWKETCQ